MTSFSTGWMTRRESTSQKEAHRVNVMNAASVKRWMVICWAKARMGRLRSRSSRRWDLSKSI
jgi:hypothetical protein